MILILLSCLLNDWAIRGKKTWCIRKKGGHIEVSLLKVAGSLIGRMRCNRCVNEKLTLEKSTDDRLLGKSLEEIFRGT